MHIDERETVVRIGYGPVGEVSVWTTERAVMAKCRKAGWKLANEARSQRGGLVGQEWVAGSNDIKISVKKPGRPKIRTGYALKGDKG
jgi:hypothetical protein